MTNFERYKEEIIEYLNDNNSIAQSLIMTCTDHSELIKIQDKYTTEEKEEIVNWFASHHIDDFNRLTFLEKGWLGDTFLGRSVKYISKTPINLYALYEDTYEVYNLKKIGFRFCGLDMNKQYTLGELGVSYGIVSNK